MNATSAETILPYAVTLGLPINFTGTKDSREMSVLSLEVEGFKPCLLLGIAGGGMQKQRDGEQQSVFHGVKH